MAETWFIAKYHSSTTMAKVEPVEIERATESSVWINGQRCAIRTDRVAYFSTRDEAVSFIRKCMTVKASAIRNQLRQLEESALRDY